MTALQAIMSKVLLVPSGGHSTDHIQPDQSGFEWITSSRVIGECFSTSSQYCNRGLSLKYSDVFDLLPVVGFLQSGSKLLFRRRHREKESCLSHSHEDISNMGNNFAATATSSRKKSGSFSRRLIKRFSFRSSGKSKGKATATNGGAGSLDN